jgi:hypothetical protein
LDLLVSQMHADGIDYLGLPLRKKVSDWPWIESHSPIYKREEIRLALSCFAIFSRRAMRFLRKRRCAMSASFASGEVPFWPNNEAFIPTEIELAGLKAASIADYGNTDAFDWWPPSFELDVASAKADHFLHPVLDQSRYIKSLVHHWPNILSLLRPASGLRKKLRRFPPNAYWPVLIRELKERLSDRLQQRVLAKLGLARSWLAAAESPLKNSPSLRSRFSNQSSRGRIRSLAGLRR